MKQPTKYIILLADGMADERIPQLGNKTPLQVAKTPYLDLLAQKGRNGLLITIPPGLSPGSETAILSIMGYDVPSVYEGRAVLEAAGMGVVIEPNEMAMRCNLINVSNNKITDYSAGQISTEEASELITFLQKKLGNDIFSFHAGISFRHLFKMKNGNKNIHCTPPHNIHHLNFDEYLIQPTEKEAEATADTLNRLIIASQQLLKDHPINKKRMAAGKFPANSIWLWSPGYKPSMQPISSLLPIQQVAMITAVDLVRGIAIYAGMEIVEVAGATGLHNTNYEGKANAAIEALKRNDMVFLHIEASDEASHEGDVDLKIKTIEYLDSRVIKPIYEKLEQAQKKIVLAVLPDHPTSCLTRKHTDKAVPFVIYHKNIVADSVQKYDEFSAKKGDEGILYNNQFINRLLNI